MHREVEASIWISELTEGRLPPVCVKSGLPADSQMSFGFDAPASTGWMLGTLMVGQLLPYGAGLHARGPLPLTHRWHRILEWSRVGAGIALPIGALVVLTSGVAPPAWRPIWLGVGFGLLAASVGSATLYGGLKPKGEVFKTPTGERWLRLREIHPNFASAVAAMDHPFMSTPPQAAD